MSCLLTWKEISVVMGWNATVSESEANREPDGMAARVMRVADMAAELARQAYEREHCRHTMPLPDALRVLIDEAVAAEREACAKMCEKRKRESRNPMVRSELTVLAGEIRDRGRE